MDSVQTPGFAFERTANKFDLMLRESRNKYHLELKVTQILHDNCVSDFDSKLIGQVELEPCGGLVRVQIIAVSSNKNVCKIVM
jgi:hypothetical protein